MLSPKNRPRYLPTLTQVVTQAELDKVVLAVPVVSDTAIADIGESHLQEIIQALMPTIRARLREISQTLLDENLHQLEEKMQVEMASMVRRALNGSELNSNAEPQ